MFAQQPNSFKLFFEKVYVHTDRVYYAAGEDIWFKAYLVNAQTGIRINTSAGLYVELLSPANEVMMKATVYLNNGLGQGDFLLPANAASGNYRIRAYTNWMKNFGDNFFFGKALQVVSDASVKGTVPARYSPNFVYIPFWDARPGANAVSFMPEGGAIVAGLPCRLAFKAVDRFGNSIGLHGKIVSAAGDSVACLQTLHAGMGSVVFTPKAGLQYRATGKYTNNELFELPLPALVPNGIVIQAYEQQNKIMVEVRSTQTIAGPLRIVARHVGKKVFIDSSVVLNDGLALVSISKTGLPYGLHIFTLYDAQQRPCCERLYFVDNRPIATIAIQPTASSYSKGKSATVELFLQGEGTKTVQARLSLSVTDASMVPPPAGSITSYLLLESELRGNIEAPFTYFDTDNPMRLQQLDLLLLTQGWRQFVWRRLQDTSVVVKHMPEPGITIAGRVQKLLGKKGLPAINVSLYAEKSKGGKLYVTKTNKDGQYFFDGLTLFGTQNIRLSTRNSEYKREGKIILDSLLGKPLPIWPGSNMLFDTSAILHNFWRNAATRVAIMKEEGAREEKGDLASVTITAQQKPDIRLVEDAATGFGADSLFVIVPADAQYKTVEQYILQRYPGAYADASQEGFFFYGDRGIRIRPRWVIDGSEDRFGTGNSMNVDEATGMSDGAYDRVDYFNIPITKVKKIYLAPMVGQRNNQLYVVHLSLHPGALDGPDFSIINATINGYYEAREFYEPVFAGSTGNVQQKSDLRNTLYWSPMLQTNTAGTASITFTNSNTDKVMVVVEGVTDSGIPVSGRVVYELKKPNP